MIIFLYGQDSYRSRQKINEIVKSYKKSQKSGLSLKYFDGELLNFEEFRDEIREISMFKEKKLMIISGVFSNNVFKKNFLEEGKIFAKSDNIILFYENNKVPEKDRFLSFLKNNSKFQEFKLLGDQELKLWLKQEFKNLNAKIEERAILKLINFVGNDLWQMENEIKKLVSFKIGETIKEEDVGKLVKSKIESDIFKTIDAIASKDKKRAFQLLRAHLEKGDSPLYLFSMINYQFRNLLMIKNASEGNFSPYRLIKLHPYVLKKSYLLSRKFEETELKKIYKRIFQIDFEIKTGKIDPQLALDLLLAEI